jgi:hypothetical protein
MGEETGGKESLRKQLMETMYGKDRWGTGGAGGGADGGRGGGVPASVSILNRGGGIRPRFRRKVESMTRAELKRRRQEEVKEVFGEGAEEEEEGEQEEEVREKEAGVEAAFAEFLAETKAKRSKLEAAEPLENFLARTAVLGEEVTEREEGEEEEEEGEEEEEEEEELEGYSFVDIEAAFKDGGDGKWEGEIDFEKEAALYEEGLYVMDGDEYNEMDSSEEDNPVLRAARVERPIGEREGERVIEIEEEGAEGGASAIEALERGGEEKHGEIEEEEDVFAALLSALDSAPAVLPPAGKGEESQRG